MDGAQDMGGVRGFGKVVPEPNEPAFHAEWERRAFALTLAMARPGGWNIDMSRYARENRPHADYLSKSYFEIWLAALERMLIERDLVKPAEIAAGHAIDPPKPGLPILTREAVEPTLRRGAPTEREIASPARFAVGDHVRMKDISIPTHTRLPRYVRGRRGVIERLHGAHVFADSNAIGAGENPQWLYTVRFEGRDLWGDEAGPGLAISVDAWESYLEPAASGQT